MQCLHFHCFMTLSTVFQSVGDDKASDNMMFFLCKRKIKKFCLRESHIYIDVNLCGTQ